MQVKVVVYFEKRNEGVPKTEIPKKESVLL